MTSASSDLKALIEKIENTVHTNAYMQKHVAQYWFELRDFALKVVEENDRYRKVLEELETEIAEADRNAQMMSFYEHDTAKTHWLNGIRAFALRVKKIVGEALRQEKEEGVNKRKEEE